jgi:hypothetical protein
MGGGVGAEGWRAVKRKLTPYQRIMRAVEAGRGVRLTFEEVLALSMDWAIEYRAALDDDPEIEAELVEDPRFIDHLGRKR